MAKELLQKEYAGPNGWTIWAVEGRIDTLTAETAYAFGEELVQTIRGGIDRQKIV